ncbi:hypothetical protein KY285_026918 [Solanum tuberosum]|nr:hypothetical protein KY285_026918 [Solanum tuberosum]
MLVGGDLGFLSSLVVAAFMAVFGPVSGFMVDGNGGVRWRGGMRSRGCWFWLQRRQPGLSYKPLRNMGICVSR